MTVLLIFIALVAAFLLGFYTMFITLKKRYPLAFHVLLATMENRKKEVEEKCQKHK